MNIQCVILAAGQNSRLNTGKPKSLLEINGVSLLERHIQAFKKAGCKEFCIVTGHNPEPVKTKIVELNEKYDVIIDAVHNDRYDLENGFSVGVTEQWLNKKNAQGFFLTMGDHIFDEQFIPVFEAAIVLNQVKENLCLAVDIPSSFNKHIDVEDVTKVLIGDDGRIVDIGKAIKEYNRYDTGLFYLKPEIFETLRLCFEQKKYSISDMVSSLIDDNQATTIDVVSCLWNDVDNFEDLKNSHNLDF